MFESPNPNPTPTPDQPTTQAFTTTPDPDGPSTQPPHSKKFHLNKKGVAILSGAIVLLVVLIVGFVVFLQTGTSSTLLSGVKGTDQVNYKYKAAISITDDGFVPATITVAKSTQLNFQNNGSSEHSIVADSETLKSEPTLGYQKGQTTTVTLPSGNYSSYYNYIFQNKGTFHIHDGFNPTANLTVIVE